MNEPDLDTVFLSYLDPDPLKAAEQYLALRKRLILFFRSRGFSDPEDLADEVVLRAFNKCRQPLELESGFAAYVFGIAKFVAMEKYKKPEPEPLPDLETPPPAPGPNAMLPPEMMIALKEHLERLTPAERSLLVGYVSEDRARLAESLGMSSNALRVKISRIRDKLQGASGGGSLKKGANA
ncbi:MAG: sigma-70 family RNA polymerase sigma factor [Acidobacteria bacterium]|nr:sigma-70 family RNA polymerase sigma factor [Acidobacteriota bacterium]